MKDPNTFKADIHIHSPGRINLIGEHIDYNAGMVLPAAIDKRISLKFKKNSSTSCEVFSRNFDSGFSFDITSISQSEVEWHNYILGVIYHINAIKPNRLEGFDCIIESNLPLGSGISSSAALECGIAKGLNELFELGLTDIEIITASRDAEHTFVGTKCGIMDQFAVVKGKKDHLIRLNCRSLDFELIEANFDPFLVVLLNSNVSHSLASSAYNNRRKECDTALKVIRDIYPEYRFLTEIPENVVKEFKNALPENIFNRALYTTQENSRTLTAVSHLNNTDFEQFGKCMYESHDGLQHLYEVSCDEIDFLVEQTRALDYVIGARMMGGGFGGCTINLVHKDKIQTFIDIISTAYKHRYDIQLSHIITTISDGVRRV